MILTKLKKRKMLKENSRRQKGGTKKKLRSLKKNHNLKLKYDFHGYMARSMEEEFQMIVGVRVSSLFPDGNHSYCCVFAHRSAPTS